VIFPKLWSTSNRFICNYIASGQVSPCIGAVSLYIRAFSRNTADRAESQIVCKVCTLEAGDPLISQVSACLVALESGHPDCMLKPEDRGPPQIWGGIWRGHVTHEPRAVTMKSWEPKRKVSKGRPNSPPKSWSVVTGPQVECEVICDGARNQWLLFRWIISIHAGSSSCI
jgi:hypothetical protein